MFERISLYEERQMPDFPRQIPEGLYQNLTGLENLIFYGSVFGLDALESKKRGLALLDFSLVEGD